MSNTEFIQSRPIASTNPEGMLWRSGIKIPQLIMGIVIGGFLVKFLKIK